MGEAVTARVLATPGAGGLAGWFVGCLVAVLWQTGWWLSGCFVDERMAGVFLVDSLWLACG